MNAVAVLPHLRDRHLDAARGRVAVGRRQARRPRARGATNVPVEHIESRAKARGLMAAAAARLGPRRPRASRAARGPPLLAGRARVPRDAAFHHLRGDDLRGLLHGLLLHPGRERRPVAGRGHRAAEARSRASTPAILVSSSFTIHCAQESIKKDNRLGLQVGHGRRRSCSARRSSSSRSTSTSTSASRRRTARRARSSTASRACTART